jgi:hypothetical protein
MPTTDRSRRSPRQSLRDSGEVGTIDLALFDLLHRLRHAAGAADRSR